MIYLTPEDRRGAVLTHGFHDPRDVDRMRAHHLAHPAGVPEPGQGMPAEPAMSEATLRQAIEEQVAPLRTELAAAQGEISGLKKSLGEQQTLLNALQAEVVSLKKALGV